jgi:hypothetical protein
MAAFFFACRSCEYLHVTVRGKTKLLCVRNIKFTSRTYKILDPYNDDLMQHAFYVSVTFEQQKNNVKNETRTQQRNEDNVLCPVRAWAYTITRILSHPQHNTDSTVNCYFDPNASVPTQYFTQKHLNQFLRHTVNLKPADYFGYDHKQIGTHSVRSGAAMALYLADEQPHNIMLLGRWSSDAFLIYLRPQVLSSFSRLSNQMILNDDFRNAAASTKRPQNDTAHAEDPRRPGDTSSIISSRRLSFYGAEKATASTTPRFHLFH